MSFEACARIVEKGDPDRFQAAMSVPLAARKVLMPIYAMNVEIVRAPWITQEAMIAEMRLQWWRDVLEEAAEGRSVRRHEVSTPLAEVLTPEAARVLDAAIEARRWDVYRDPFASWDDLRRYVEATTGGVMAAAGLSLGSQQGVEPKGFGVGLARFLLAVPSLIAHGRRPLPSVSREELVIFIDTALEAMRGPSKAPQHREGFLAKSILRTAVQHPELVLDRLPEPSPLRRSALLMKATLIGA